MPRRKLKINATKYLKINFIFRCRLLPKKSKFNDVDYIDESFNFNHWRDWENFRNFRVRECDFKNLNLEIRKKYFSSTSLTQKVNISFTQNHHDLINLTPDFVQLPTNQTYTFNISLEGLSPGHMDVTGTADPKNVIDDSNLFFRIIVANSRIIIYVSLIVGWVYFVAWSISFYPQIFINYKRKSVVGLSFDFMALNFVGHTLYAIFNVCLYFVPFFQEEYFLRFPRGTNPVELNDVFFSIHASFITALTISQCFLYEV